VRGFNRSSACPGVRQTVQFDVSGEPLTIEISRAGVPRINIAVMRVWPWSMR
jgi:hypothetical protein